MKTVNPQTEWKAYCDKFNSGASRSELLKAAKAMKDLTNRKVALLNLGVMTAEDKKQIKARWESINAVTEKEIATHCQFDGFFSARAGYV